MSDIKIRLQGLPDDVAAVADRLHGFVEVLEESEDYPNRGDSQFIRRYLTVRLPEIPPRPKPGQVTHFSNLKRHDEG